MIADRIKLARRKAGLSPRTFCRNGRESHRTGDREIRARRGYSELGSAHCLAKALDVSLRYLLDTDGIELSNVEFRTKASRTGRDRAQVETKVLEWIERDLQIEQILELDNAKWECPFDRAHQLRTVEGAENLANQVRAKWELGLDPIPNMTELLEEKGLKVLTVSLPSRVSGFTCLVGRGEGKPALPVVVVNDQSSLERRRLTLAHELAHRLIDTDSLSDKDEEKAATLFAGFSDAQRASAARSR